MDYRLADKAAVVPFDVIVEGNFASPDVGSVTFTLRDNAGAAVVGQTDIAVSTTAGQTSFNVTIALGYNAKVLDTETRTVVVSFTVGSKPYSMARVYTLTDFLPMACTAADVRVLTGAAASELPDADIDLVAGYFELAETLTVATLNAALTAGGRRAMAINRAIAAQAALSLLPSLQLRVNQIEKSDAVSFQRYAGVDWDRLRDALRNLVGDGMAAAQQTATGAPTLIFVNAPVDPITGA